MENMKAINVVYYFIHIKYKHNLQVKNMSKLFTNSENLFVAY